MAKVSEIPALLEPIKTQLTVLGDQLTASGQQLEKAKTEIINALQNVELSPEATAAIESLGAVASGLVEKGAAVATVSEALDALNEDEPAPEQPASEQPAS